MTTLPLIFRDGHLFVELDRNLWILDTGAPTSFGAVSNIIFARQEFRLAASFFGLTSAALSRLVGVTCVGLLGADVLRHFDHILTPLADSHYFRE